MNQDLSIVIIANNASLRIGEVLGAVRRLSDDIVVLDSGSEDDTVEIALDLGASIHHQEWRGYSATKNIGNGLASHDWILSVDADEVLSEQLIDSIEDLEFRENEIYLLDRVNYFCGKKIRFSHWYPDRIPRLFNRKLAHWEGDFVHEKLIFNSNIKTRLLRGKLHHYSYETYQQRKEKITSYAQLSAYERFQKGKRTNWLWTIITSITKFFITYVIHLGFLDGYAGLQIAYTDALQTWLRSMKMLQLQKDTNPPCCK